MLFYDEESLVVSMCLDGDDISEVYKSKYSTAAVDGSE